MKKLTLLFILIFLVYSNVKAQKKEINWITFEQLEDSLKVKSKKVFISFYADWCSYCKKMDEAAYKNNEVISKLNQDFYSIKLNAETKDTIYFEGKGYINNQIGKSRRPTHQIPLLLASRKNKPFSLPATLILNEKFMIEQRFFEYISPKKMISILKD